MANEIAADGQVFVCMACGKLSQDLYGSQGASPGWDESCALNARLCHRDKLEMNPSGTRVINVLDGGLVPVETPERK